MHTIDLFAPQTPPYTMAQRLAQGVYRKKYDVTINPTPEYFCVVSDDNATPIGCVGFYPRTLHTPLLIENYFEKPLDDMIKESCHTNQPISCVELGTRAIDIDQPTQTFNSLTVSAAMMSQCLFAARKNGITHALFTSHPIIYRNAKTYGFTLIDLGPPSLMHTDAAFRRRWHHFFAIKQRCYVMNVAQNIANASALAAASTEIVFSSRHHNRVAA